jgi:hypothetical protein
MAEARTLDIIAGKAMCGQPIFMSDDVGRRPHKGVAVSRIDFGEDGHIKGVELYYNIGDKVYKTTATPGTIIGL